MFATSQRGVRVAARSGAGCRDIDEDHADDAAFLAAGGRRLEGALAREAEARDLDVLLAADRTDEHRHKLEHKGANPLA